MNEDSWEALVERLQQTMRSTYVPANTHIFNPNDPSYANSVGIIFLRHGEVKQWLICHEQGYYVESGAHCNLDYMDCVDMLGVTDHAFVNEHEIAVERIESIEWF